MIAHAKYDDLYFSEQNNLLSHLNNSMDQYQEASESQLSQRRMSGKGSSGGEGPASRIIGSARA